MIKKKYNLGVNNGPHRRARARHQIYKIERVRIIPRAVRAQQAVVARDPSAVGRASSISRGFPCARWVVKGLIKYELSSMHQFYEFYSTSMKWCKTAFTTFNAHSSRSHAIFTVYMEQTHCADSRVHRVRQDFDRRLGQLRELTTAEEQDHQQVTAGAGLGDRRAELRQLTAWAATACRR